MGEKADVKELFKLDDGQVALVKGAPRGLGLQMTRALGAMGCRLVMMMCRRSLERVADGSNEVHRNAIAKMELARYAGAR